MQESGGPAIDPSPHVPARTWLLSMTIAVMATAIAVGAAWLPARRAAFSTVPPVAAAPVTHWPAPAPAGRLLHPGVPADRSGLAFEMERRLALARAAAAEAGVRLRVNSGWRSTRRQAALQRQAVSAYGSEAEAARWVLPPEKSEHPKGRAVDIGPPSAARWLGREGYRFGLCRRYANEPWHFEPLTWPGDPCPAPERSAAG